MAAFDHVTVPVVQLAVKVKVVGKQTDKLGGLVIVGAVGLAFICSPETAVLAGLGQPLTVQVAVIE